MADITASALRLTDSKGRTIKRWSRAEFSHLDNWTWFLETGYRVSGQAPWTLTLTVTDSAGQTSMTSATIQR